MKAVKSFVLWFSCCFCHLCSAQTLNKPSQWLGYSQYMQQVLAFHPVARQAVLLSDKARAEVRMARGLFDPVLKAGQDQKNFQNKFYYKYDELGLQVPLWIGNIKAGYDNADGPYVNNDQNTPAEGLSYLGLELPIGQGLFMDERRATLREAQILQKMAEAERVKAINKLLLNAAKDYWDWCLAWNKFTITSQSLELAQNRKLAIKQRVLNGDLAAIDTLEAGLQVQQLEVLTYEADMQLKNALLELSVNLWTEDVKPVLPEKSWLPDSIPARVSIPEKSEQPDFISKNVPNHPETKKLKLKVDQLEIGRKWALEKLKPKLNVNFSMLQTGFASPIDQGTSINNLWGSSKAGIYFSYPLFLREARGKVQLSNLKLKETNWQLENNNREIAANIEMSFNELESLKNQVLKQNNLVIAYQTMLEAEQKRFEAGESSIFLINSRQSSLLNGQLKLYELKAKQAKAAITLQWNAGLLQLTR